MSGAMIDLQKELEKHQEDSSELLKEVQEIVLLLVKTLKIFCIYPQDNPIPNEFKNNLFRRFSEFLEENEELKIRVDQSKLCSRDKVILKEEKKDEGVSFALYRDGIRELTFQKGIEKEELFSFLEIISRGLKSTLPEDDIVTLFWEKELSHIKFLVVDEFLNEDLSGLPQIVGDKDLGKIYYSEVDLGEKTEKGKVLATKIEIDRFLRDLDLVPEKEQKELKTLIDKDKSFEPLKELFEVLKEIFLSEKELPDFSETISILEKLLDSLVSQGDFYLASEVLLLLKEIEKIEAEEGQSNRYNRVKEALSRAGDKERMRSLTQILNQNSNIDLFSARKYLSLLDWNTIPHLVDMLGELENFTARKMVCSVLENTGEENIDIISKGVYDRRWYVVRNIVGVLGRIGSTKAVPYLKKTVNHQDLRVRKETLEALSRIPGKEATEVLLDALEDTEERIRIKTAKVLGERAHPEVLDYLSNLVFGKDFKDKSQAEKSELLKTWVKLGKDAVLPLLKKLILKRAWLKRDKQRETSYLALKALALIDTPSGQDILKELCSKGNRKIRQQARVLFEKRNAPLTPEENKLS